MTRAVAIPMKDPSDAKSRLAPALGNDAREALALLLFENALTFFLRLQAGQPLGVVTRSERIAQIAAARGAEIIAEPPGAGLNGAAACAADWAERIGAGQLLVAHADIPALADAEVEALLEAGKESAVTIAESIDGGTNALLLSPPDAIPFRFGPGSAEAHAAEARRTGLSCERLMLPMLSRDIDTPDDLDRHLRAGAAGGATLHGFALADVPEIAPGDDLAAAIGDALLRSGQTLHDGDIVVVAQKIVSKAEGRMVALAAYEPSSEARRIAAEVGKDARKVEAILRESSEVIRLRRQPPDGLVITRHRQGWICANAGIDESNLGPGRDGMLLLLPEDPDASAAGIGERLKRRFGVPVGVVISDTFGRPWRQGLVNVAIGVSSVPALVDWAGRTDAYGRGLKATLPAFADEAAAAAGLLMAKDAGKPVVILRGLSWQADAKASARDVLRTQAQELFL